MEYSLDMFLSSGESLILRLSRLMTTFDETAAVTPYRSSKAVSRYELWLESVERKKTVREYVGGISRSVERLRLYLRHKSVSAEDIAEAERILTEYLSRLTMAFSETEVYDVEAGEVFHCATDSSVWDSYVDFAVYRYDFSDNADVNFYVAFGDEAPMIVSAGCLKFEEKFASELYSRRYFDEGFYRTDTVGEKRSISFEFETTLPRCVLRPILLGESTVRVYKVFDTGKAEEILCVISGAEVSADLCSGTLASAADVRTGNFMTESGEFIPDKAERRVDG